jgi:hypothetical protein
MAPLFGRVCQAVQALLDFPKGVIHRHCPEAKRLQPVAIHDRLQTCGRLRQDARVRRLVGPGRGHAALHLLLDGADTCLQGRAHLHRDRAVTLIEQSPCLA